VVGLGYVGLPLATALAKHFDVLGFDVSESRIAELAKGFDRNASQVSPDLVARSLTFTSRAADLKSAGFFIVAVPTPVDQDNIPDLRPVKSACNIVGPHIRPGTTIVFESTVYPGCTEEECIPILEECSGLKAHVDFGVGYSPERIDPGNSDQTLETIVKIISAGDPGTLDRLEAVYGSVVTAGVYRAPDIRTAEAAKVIENVQRDLNIALMNELSVLFHQLELSTTEVLKAAGTKWNFLKFHPGLVGGHCIPVDPYYLVHKAASIGHEPQVILAGRRVNDSMASYVVSEAVGLLEAAGTQPKSARALVMGLTFKENIPDIRNSQPMALVRGLEAQGVDVFVHDPILDPAALSEKVITDPFSDADGFDLVVMAVPHDEYLERTPDAYVGLLRGKGRGVFVDVRGALGGEVFTKAGIAYWQL
jgi:UDP-N-acetyl-D-galactosamine dehydrogenase